MTEMGDITVVPRLCDGSGKRPAERVILDTIPGLDPMGTCPVCGKHLTLKWYRMPEHRSDGG